MITPFGRYRWARLPFGLKVSSEIFQRKLTEAVGDLNGTFWHFTDRVNFLIVDFYTITCNFVTMKCYFFQSDFFLTNKEVVLQVDSSKNGVGAVLLQDGKPVEFASRALRQSERNWAQIEKEALSMLFALI
jgi:hypothetical protein